MDRVRLDRRTSGDKSSFADQKTGSSSATDNIIVTYLATVGNKLIHYEVHTFSLLRRADWMK